MHHNIWHNVSLYMYVLVTFNEHIWTTKISQHGGIRQYTFLFVIRTVYRGSALPKMLNGNMQ